MCDICPSSSFSFFLTMPESCQADLATKNGLYKMLQKTIVSTSDPVTAAFTNHVIATVTPECDSRCHKHCYRVYGSRGWGCMLSYLLCRSLLLTSKYSTPKRELTSKAKRLPPRGAPKNAAKAPAMPISVCFLTTLTCFCRKIRRDTNPTI
jgi:hypothetical protein